MKIKKFLQSRKLESESQKRKMGTHQLRCNLCDRAFRAASGFHRFCRTCRLEDELFRFSEWLPEAGPA